MAKKRRTEQPSDQQSETLLWSVLCIQPFCMSWHGTVLLYNTITIELQFSNIVFVVCTSDPDGSDQQPRGTHVTYYSMPAVNSYVPAFFTRDVSVAAESGPYGT